MFWWSFSLIVVVVVYCVAPCSPVARFFLRPIARPAKRLMRNSVCLWPTGWNRSNRSKEWQFFLWVFSNLSSTLQALRPSRCEFYWALNTALILVFTEVESISHMCCALCNSTSVVVSVYCVAFWHFCRQINSFCLVYVRFTCNPVATVLTRILTIFVVGLRDSV